MEKLEELQDDKFVSIMVKQSLRTEMTMAIAELMLKEGGHKKLSYTDLIRYLLNKHTNAN